MRKQSIPGRFSPPTRPGYEARLGVEWLKVGGGWLGVEWLKVGGGWVGGWLGVEWLKVGGGSVGVVRWWVGGWLGVASYPGCVQ